MEKYEELAKAAWEKLDHGEAWSDNSIAWQYFLEGYKRATEQCSVQRSWSDSDMLNAFSRRVGIQTLHEGAGRTWLAEYKQTHKQVVQEKIDRDIQIGDYFELGGKIYQLSNDEDARWWYEKHQKWYLNHIWNLCPLYTNRRLVEANWKKVQINLPVSEPDKESKQ